MEKAKLILPQILNDKAWSDQGRINISEMMKLLKISQNTAYLVRRELKHYHEHESARASQWGTDTTAEKPTSSQQEEKTK